MSLDKQVPGLSEKDTRHTESMTLEQLVRSLAVLEVRVTDMEETLDSLSEENTSVEEMT